MRAGKLDQTISLWRLEEDYEVNASGMPREVWRHVDYVRAEFVRNRADEIGTGYGEAQATTVIFRIRWRPAVTTADQIKHDGKSYKIKEIVEIGRRRGLELRAVAVS